jgi:hypothetical protein
MRPLQWIEEHPPNQGRARQIFLLTDGEISNVTEVLDLCRSMATSTRIFSFGLGKSPSRSLVKGLARATNGRFVFIPPNSSVDVYVGEQLQKALQPCLTNVQVKWNLGVDVQNAPKQTPPVYANDRLIVYALTNDKTIPFDHNSSVELLTETNRSIGVAQINQIPNVAENETIARLAAKALILELQHAKLPSASAKRLATGSTQARFNDLTTSTEEKKEVILDEQTTKQRIIELSLKYNILSPHTAFVGIEKRTNSSNADMVLREVPIEISADDQHLLSQAPVMCFAAAGGMMNRPMPSMAMSRNVNSASFGSAKRNLNTSYSRGAMAVPQSMSYASAAVPMNASFDSFSSSAYLRDDMCDSESVSNVQKNDVWPSTDQDIVRYLINKQKFDGLWNADDDIIKNLTGKSLSAFRSSTTTTNVTDEILASIIVVIILETKFATFSSLSHGVVQKARKRITDLLKTDSINLDTLILDIRQQL